MDNSSFDHNNKQRSEDVFTLDAFDGMLQFQSEKFLTNNSKQQQQGANSSSDTNSSSAIGNSTRSSMNFNNSNLASTQGSLTSNMNSQQQQQLLNLMARQQATANPSINSSSLLNNVSGNGVGGLSTLQQYQLLSGSQSLTGLQQQPQQQAQQSSTMSQQQRLQAQLNLLQQQTQQQQLQLNDLSFNNRSQSQRQHSLSLGNLDFGGSNGLQMPQVQQPQQQQARQEPRHSLSFRSALSAQNGLTLQQQQQQKILEEQQQMALAADSSASTASALLALQQQQPTLHANNNDSKPAAASGGKNKQKEFLLFIKILLKCLDATQNASLKGQAKAIVSECTRRNRMGDPAYMPLQDAVEQRLRGVVGEDYWKKAQNYVQKYHAQQPQLVQRANVRVRQLQQQRQAVLMGAGTRTAV